ncbi:hypothetical protein OG429_22320 [Streptomyces sp. NBC_00190]|uniref:hypothetical protein n=1 Tax=unclassified Streptomyces TaxID=2593676 RepID=UPI002E2A3E93|nr:hypothetical protein [Streptomyces sp. NBC_00190]WSZ41776.1 hypothetical protein OG239_25090 [Streptomyces sp. NBC_00868]
MTSIHRLALLKAAIAVGAIRLAPSAVGASPMPPSTGTLIPMRPDHGGPEHAEQTPQGSLRAHAA